MATASDDDDEHVPIINDRWFLCLVYSAIFVSAIQLGMEVDHPDAHDVLQVSTWVCLSIFIFELGAKLLILRCEFWRSGWNIFDLLLVALSLVDIVGLEVGPVIVLRMFRMLKIARVLRFLRVFRQLWLLVSGIVS